MTAHSDLGWGGRWVAAILAAVWVVSGAAVIVLVHRRWLAIVEAAEWTTREATLAPALVLYTSGSTGRPKGALLSHTAVEVAERSWAGPVMALTADDVVLATLPLSHSFGLNGALLAPLLA